MRVFIGYDPRQPVAYNVLQHSIIKRSSKPVQITPLVLSQLPLKRRGLTEFTFSRFMVPYLCGYEGVGLFLDADMLCLDDISGLFDLARQDFDVMVVKNKLRFEWGSLMLFNNARCKILTPEFVETTPTPLALKWGTAGDLPSEWNHCIGYDEPQKAKLVHFTKGIPVWPETKGCEYTEEWWEDFKSTNSTVSHQELMGNSVHV